MIIILISAPVVCADAPKGSLTINKIIVDTPEVEQGSSVRGTITVGYSLPQACMGPNHDYPWWITIEDTGISDEKGKDAGSVSLNLHRTEKGSGESGEIEGTFSLSTSELDAGAHTFHINIEGKQWCWGMAKPWWYYELTDKKPLKFEVLPREKVVVSDKEEKNEDTPTADGESSKEPTSPPKTENGGEWPVEEAKGIFAQLFEAIIRLITVLLGGEDTTTVTPTQPAPIPPTQPALLPPTPPTPTPTTKTAPNITKGLIAYYKFDESSGNTAKDSAGNKDGTVYGEAQWVAGIKGNAISFDGKDDYVKIPGKFNFSSTNQLTIAGWFNLSDHKNYSSIVCSTETAEPHDIYYRTMIGPNRNPFYNAGYHSDQLVRDYTINKNLWYHYALTVQGGGEAKLYIDGKLKHRVDDMKGWKVPQILPDIKTALWIGCDGYNETAGAPAYPINGIIDEVRIYNRALSAKDIAYLASTE